MPGAALVLLPLGLFAVSAACAQVTQLVPSAPLAQTVQLRERYDPLAQLVPASDGEVLTLTQAESTALQHEPALQAALFRARAAAQQTAERASVLQPQLNANVTGALVADTGTATAAGFLTTSSLSDRFAFGGALSQLVTDFGHTRALIDATRFEAEAASQRATLTRAEIRLHVRDAYYQALGAEAVLRAAISARDTRALVARQTGELAKSQLRSTLDVNFAEVLESQAELAVVQARTAVLQQRAALGAAMGSPEPVTAPLAAGMVTAPNPPQGLQPLLADASKERADLLAARDDARSAQRFATSQHRLYYPSLTVLAAGGEIPYRDHTLQDNYAAAGFNLQIPVLNGGLFHADQLDAELQAKARTRDAEETRVQVSRQVHDAWYAATEAFTSITVANRLVAQSREALRLAQARYDAGLGSIVELNEAQMNETSAEITTADANATYLARQAALQFVTGQLN